MQKFRLSISPCPNDTFMFHAMLHGLVDTEGLSFEVEYHDIEELNAGVINRLPDVSKISCAVLPAVSAPLPTAGAFFQKRILAPVSEMLEAKELIL